MTLQEAMLIVGNSGYCIIHLVEKTIKSVYGDEYIYRCHLCARETPDDRKKRIHDAIDVIERARVAADAAQEGEANGG